jgi:hypothetical protein
MLCMYTSHITGAHVTQIALVVCEIPIHIELTEEVLDQQKVSVTGFLQSGRTAALSCS